VTGGVKGSWEHGTESGYRNGGCKQRCCLDAHARYNRGWREPRSRKPPAARQPRPVQWTQAEREALGELLGGE